MPYVTIRQSPRMHQVTLEEILRGHVPMSRFAVVGNTSCTTTCFVENTTQQMLQNVNVQGMIVALNKFLEQYKDLYSVERSKLYHTFYIPKNSGGFRRIDAPLPELMDALRQLKTMLEEFGALYHTTAFAYVRGRCAVDAVKRHQKNNSKWFLKLDFENFFGNTTEDFLFSMVSSIFPFSEIVAANGGEESLRKALDLCFLNGGLPQGTPISPLLTNLMMIPIDHVVNRELVSKHFVYTRYADDLLISSRYDFKFSEIVDLVTGVLEKFGAPFKIKKSKTRYGSSSGQNWNLGVMLNKDNEITIGRKKKDRLKAALFNYLQCKKNKRLWDLYDIQVLAGQMSYYSSVEPEWVREFIQHFNGKFGCDVMAMIKQDLR